MKKAQGRNALHEQKFWFRNDIQNKDNKEYSLMTVNEIINGKEVKTSFSSRTVYHLKLFEVVNCICLCLSCLQGFPGLVPLIQTYLNSMDVDADTQCTLQQYLSLISKRAKGDVMTAAKWLREFVTSHPDYKKDSVISEEINYDLLKRIGTLATEPCSKLHGSIIGSKTQDDVPDILTR